MKTKISRGLWFVATLALSMSSVALGADNKAESMKDSPEQRQKMAKMHREMADCLESKRPMKECHATMAKGGGCPMMDGNMGGMMGEDGMMKKKGDNK